MIFTTEFIESVRKCKTSKELTEKLRQVEEVISNLRKMRDLLEQKEIAAAAKEMIKHNKEY